MEQRNGFRETLESGEVAIGAETKTASPAAIAVLGDLGFDFVWVDTEHAGPSPDDAHQLGTLVRAAEVAETTLLVRLPSGDPPLVRKALDAGVRTLLVPRLETAAEVREAVAASRFEYEGEPGDRGAASGPLTGWRSPDPGYAEREDGAVTVGVMIENAAALERIEEILAVPELGFVFVGPADLSVSLGHPLDPDHPDVRSAISRIVDAATSAGVPVGGIRNDPADARAAIDDGYRMLRVGSELGAAQSTLGSRLDRIRDR